MDRNFDKEKSLKLAERYAQQGKIASAIEEYKKVLTADPSDLRILNTLGDLYSRTGHTQKSIQYLSLVGDRYASGGHVVKAIAVYKKVTKLDPANFELALKLGDLYAKQSLMADAHAQYMLVVDAHRKIGNVQEGLRILKRAIELDPANTRIRVQLAKILAEENYPQEAAEAYRIAGQELLRKGHTQESIEALESALALAPESRPALKALAEAYSSRGNVQPALDMIVRALEIDPNDIDLIVILGRTFLNAGMVEKAEATFNRLLKLDNSRYDYLLEVARAYVGLGQFNRTMSIIDRCIELMLARRQKKKATALLKAILEKDPDNVLALKRLAGIYKQVRERRNLVNTLNRLVQAALAQELRAEAIVAIKQLIEIEPTKIAYQEQLKSLGDESQALLEKALELVIEDDEGHQIHMQEPKAQATAAAAAASDSRRSEVYDSYGDYSTELMEEMIAQHPEFLEARLKLLEDLVAQQPHYTEGRVKLRQYYLDQGSKDKAATQCIELARLSEQRGDVATTRQYLLEAYELNPSLNPLKDAPAAQNTSNTNNEPATDQRRDATDSGATDTGFSIAHPSTRLVELLSLEEFERYFEWEWRRATRDHKPLSVIKIGVDRYATLEGEHGVEEATQYLEIIAAALEKQISRSGQMLAYCGEQEFFALLPETHPGAALAAAEAMRAGVENLRLPHFGNKCVSISLGVATAFPYRITSPEPLIIQIDQALHHARGAGGNKVVVAPLLGG